MIGQILCAVRLLHSIALHERVDPSGGNLIDRDVSWRPAFIDFTIPSNISAWFATRQVIVDFGLEFRDRLSTRALAVLCFLPSWQSFTRLLRTVQRCTRRMRWCSRCAC